MKVIGKPQHLEPVAAGRVGVLDYSGPFINVLDGSVDFRSDESWDGHVMRTQYVIALADGREVRLPGRMIRRIGFVQAGPDGEPRFIEDEVR
jgi:hypothetical protein